MSFPKADLVNAFHLARETLEHICAAPQGKRSEIWHRLLRSCHIGPRQGTKFKYLWV